jgi:signal transduction histidine kinase
MSLLSTRVSKKFLFHCKNSNKKKRQSLALTPGCTLNIIAEKILMSVPSIIVVIDLNNRIVFANTAFGKLTSRRTQDYIGKLLNEVIAELNPKWEPLFVELAKTLNDSEKEKHPEFRKLKSDDNYDRDPLNARTGEPLDFNPPSVITLEDKIFTYRIFNTEITPTGEPLKGLILSDLTEEKDFLDRMTQAENISSLKTLAAGISHEISNPLHSIMSFSEAMCNENDLNKIKHYSERIVDNSIRLGNVLTKFSGYISDKENGLKTETNVNKTIKSATKFAMLPFQNSEIVLEEDIKDLPNLMTDPEDLQQVFFNIINNACQAMKEKGKLKISTSEKDGFLLIKFKDNGPGMPKEILRKVFNPFFTTKMQGEGTGLGLNITQRLVEKYNGKIEIQSREGQGTEVSVFFPNPSRDK